MFQQIDSQTLSQISSWSEENVEKDINQAISILSHGQISPFKYVVKKNVDDLKSSTLRAVKRKTLATLDALLNGKNFTIFKIVSCQKKIRWQKTKIKCTIPRK